MLKVRLQRTGKRGQAYFRVVVVEHTKKPRGEFLELLGNYDPHKKELNVKMDRVEYWVSKGAQTSPTVNNLLVNYKYWDKPKMQSWKPKKKPTTNDQQPTTQKETPTETAIEPQPASTESSHSLNESRAGQAGEAKSETQPAEESEQAIAPTPTAVQ